MLVLIGIPIIAMGFILRFNPLLVVVIAGLSSTLLSGKLGLGQSIELLGQAFIDNRYVGVVWLILPLLALLERNGLRSQAKNIISGFKNATTGRILMIYFLFRQITAALGLLSIGGHAQMVRPLIAPMAEAASINRFKHLTQGMVDKIKAHAAAVDNIGAFFGEDIFIAIQSILLIKAFFETQNIFVEPLNLAVWAIPTAICAALIHFYRLRNLDKYLSKNAGRA